MRYITLNNEGELIADEGGGYSLVDYTKLAKEDFSKNVGVEYIKFGIISDYSNEIFINYYIRQKEWEYLIKEDDILVKSKGNSISHFLWNDLVERKNNPPQKSSSLIFLFPWAKLFLACLVCFTLVTLRKLFNFKRRKATAKSIAIVRSKASHSKLSLINEQESILLLSEDIVYRNRKLQSMFSYFSFGQCLIAMFKSIGSAFRDFSFLIREVDSIFGSRVTARIISNYSFRVALKSIYEQLLFCFLKSGLVSDLVTGNKEDRFAMVEKRLCAKFGVCLTCIPHGLEYTYKFPSGIAGNVFYCTSEKSKEVLSKIYPTILFVHDEHLQKSLYQLSEPGKYNKEEIVFFTESRDVDINRKIIDELNSLSLKYTVRLHPKDSESNYLDKSVIFSQSYNDAISNKICISRKSTILLEALYNGSISIAYLIDSKDDYYVSHIFPSLSSMNINKCRDSDSLARLLKIL